MVPYTGIYQSFPEAENLKSVIYFFLILWNELAVFKVVEIDSIFQLINGFFKQHLRFESLAVPASGLTGGYMSYEHGYLIVRNVLFEKSRDYRMSE